MDGARLIQFMIAGVDFIPLGEPRRVCQWQPTAALPSSMAEHALAMALAAAKCPKSRRSRKEKAPANRGKAETQTKRSARSFARKRRGTMSA